MTDEDGRVDLDDLRSLRPIVFHRTIGGATNSDTDIWTRLTVRLNGSAKGDLEECVSLRGKVVVSSAAQREKKRADNERQYTAVHS